MDAIRTDVVDFRADGDTAPGYLARPHGDGPFPGVVVIQEWWGLNDHIKDVARRLAAQGFAALAPDLYRGQVAAEPDDARKLAMNLERDRAIRDIQGAVNFLIEQSFVQPKKIGVMGFCMGGGIALSMSYRGENVGAVAVFYGRPEPDTTVYRGVTAPVLGLYGEADQGIPVESVRQLDEALSSYDKPHEIVIYPGAPHAFFNDERPSYRREAAEDAWKRTLEWFRRYLVPA
jgi:carboxymethylenebutenolidase